jgi:hypothetical protein
LSEPAVKDAIGSEAVATVGASRGAERCAGASTVKVLVRMLCFMVDRRNHRSEWTSPVPVPVSSRSPHAHSTTVSTDGSAPLGQHKY